MSYLTHLDYQTAHPSAARLNDSATTLGRLTTKARGAKGLAGVLAAGGVSAAIVVADQIVSAWADGHLLLAWIAMWVIVFALLAIFSDAIRGWPDALRQGLADWVAAANRSAADRRTWDSALADPRLMAELQHARIRAETEAAANGSTPPHWPFPGLPEQRPHALGWA